MAAMQTVTEERRRSLRRGYVDRFLAEFDVPFASLAESTQKELDQWARQAQLVEDQPSANWRQVILQLCIAVECQLAAHLGSIEGFSFLAAASALGPKAKQLKNTRFDSSSEERITSHGINPSFVSSELAALMLRLAFARGPKAHGKSHVQSFTIQDASEVRQLAGQILRGICSQRGGLFEHSDCL